MRHEFNLNSRTQAIEAMLRITEITYKITTALPSTLYQSHLEWLALQRKNNNNYNIRLVALIES